MVNDRSKEVFFGWVLSCLGLLELGGVCLGWSGGDFG